MSTSTIQRTMSCASIESQLREASYAYYNGTPIMEDWEFDALWQAHKENRQTLPDDPTWTDTILDHVGATVRDGVIKVRNKHLSFEGGAEEAISFVTEMHVAYHTAAMDMNKTLHDFVFAIEVALQNEGYINEDFNVIAKEVES